MLGGHLRRLGAVFTGALSIAGALPGGASAEGPPTPEQASFDAPRLFPGYEPAVHDYVVRCRNRALTVRAEATDPWQVSVDGRPFRSGELSVTVPLRAGYGFTVAIGRVDSGQRHRYFVRCLPSDFPTYTFTRSGPVSPRFFTADNAFAPIRHRYAIIFDDNGVPVWWYHAPVEGPTVLADGTILWFHSNGRSSRYKIHRLNGSLVRSLGTAAGMPVDGHDLQLLANGRYLIGGHAHRRRVDTRAFGGSASADVLDARLQEISPQGRLLWDWKSDDHISLRETGRWWPFAIRNPARSGYDVAHWNSIEPHGNSVIASFRQLDAVYKISKATGRIAWKLGGTRTGRSLAVRGDPHEYPLGAQHDARLLGDGSLSVFDNRSALADPMPRMVRYRINPAARRATLLQSISDPEVPASYCCGSARRLPNGDWLIGWGLETQGTGPSGSIGGYRADGQRTFLLRFDSTFSYRALPVPPGAVSRQSLRKGMTAMCSPGCR
jgi:hypothetical protein